MVESINVVNIYCNNDKKPLKTKKANLDFFSKKICILSPPHCFFIAHQIKLNLRGYNTECKISSEEYQDENYNYIVICPQFFKELPGVYISYQMEQKSSNWFDSKYITTLENSHSILDYSIDNINHLINKGLAWKQFFYMPVGGIPNYKQFLEENGYRLIRPFKKYDVLFYGVICDRRRKIIDELSTSFNIHIESDCFGEELVSKVLNSRVVVNIHYYEDAILETTRIHEVLSLGIPVVSEDSTDIHRYEDLAKVVKFVKSGCVDSLKQEISFLLRNEYEYNSTVESIKNYVNNSYEKANYYFLRYMLAWNWITFEDFYRYGEKYIGLNFNTDKLCLTIDENNRCCKETKNTLLEEGFNFVTGVRHNVPWIGCGLSYKYIARKSLDKDIIPLTICEDDTIFNEKFKTKYRTILRYLKQNKNKWHLFSGLSAHFNKDAKILKIEEFEGIEFIYLNKVVSTVFNIYSKDILQIISVWDHKDAELTLLPIDRYIESMNDLVVITTIPYLAGHNSEQTSTLWNFNNIEYSQMIAESQNLLQIKVNEYKQKELRYN
jgi:GR25 family glycosyltransferase involved in LPS biosynthesis